MKFFHLSDLHIGLKLMNHDLNEDQAYILDQVAELAEKEKPDAVVIAGDIYDKSVPSAEAVDLFDHFIGELTGKIPEAEIMMISGNHDSASRVNLFRGVLEHHKIHMIGIPPQTEEEKIEKVTMTDTYGKVNFYLLPFVKPSMVRAIVGTDANGNNLSYDEALHRMIERENVDTTERNVLVSHQFYLPAGTDPGTVERMGSEIVTVGNLDAVKADLLSCFDYAALGHIHKPMKVGSECYRYCGTPISCSVSEAGQQKGIILVEMGKKGDVKTSVLPLKPLHQVKVIKGTLEEVVKQGCEDFVTVILTDQVDQDVFDTRDRILRAFPNLLEIRRETVRSVDYDAAYTPEAEADPFTLCCNFLGDVDEEEKAILMDILSEIQGGAH